MNNSKRRDREIRDVYNKLRAKYTASAVKDFIETNYFVGSEALYKILSRVDKGKVQRPSMLYTTAMDPEFKL